MHRNDFSTPVCTHTLDWMCVGEWWWWCGSYVGWIVPLGGDEHEDAKLTDWGVGQ